MTYHAIILMTALVPTTGHADLVKFAAHLPNMQVHVLINGRTFEPVLTEHRVEDMKKHFSTYNNVEIIGRTDDNAPQNPKDLPDKFWDFWRNEIISTFPHVDKWDYVISSEPYGRNVAESLNALFLPYDISRLNNPSRGTEIRDNLWSNWDKLLLETRQRMMITVTMFGQESVGKTTLMQELSNKLNVKGIVEFARPYLEEVGEELNQDKMRSIYLGQSSLQSVSKFSAVSPVLIQDTDLFSTVGYYRVLGLEPLPELVGRANELASDIYYIMPDSIPLVPDQLRYGGNVRETNMSFWIQLLDEFHQNYVIVPDGSVTEKRKWIIDDIKFNFNKKVKSIKDFCRD